MRLLASVAVGIGLWAACSGPSGSSDAGSSRDASVGGDAGTPDAGAAGFVETEPNDGAAASDVNPIILPTSGTGIIDPADDMDILSTTLTAGTFVTWTLQAPAASGVAPHLGITEDGDHVPHLVALAVAGGVATQEQFVLEGAKYYVFVRDARNVPAASSQHIGGATYAWRLQAAVTPHQHTAATFPSTVSGTLRSRHAVDTYAFTAATAFALGADPGLHGSPSGVSRRETCVRPLLASGLHHTFVTTCVKQH